MYRDEENDDKYFRKSRGLKGFLVVSVLFSLILIGLIFIVKPPDPADDAAFGFLYGEGEDRPVVTGARIEFDDRGPFLNTDPDPTTNTIEILTSGVYEVSASVQLALPPNSGALFFIRVNDAPPVSNATAFGSVTFIEAGGTFRDTPGKTVQIALNAGDELSIVPEEAFGGSQYTFASLTVNRIGPNNGQEN